MKYHVYVLMKNGISLLEPIDLGNVDVNWFTSPNLMNAWKVTDKGSFPKGCIYNPTFKMESGGVILATGMEPANNEGCQKDLTFGPNQPVHLQMWVLSPELLPEKPKRARRKAR